MNAKDMLHDGRRAPGRRRERAAPGSRGDRRYGHSRRRADRPRRDEKAVEAAAGAGGHGPGHRDRHGRQRRRRHLHLFHGRRELRLRHPVGHPHHVRAARRRGDHGRPHGRRHGQGLRRPHPRALRHPHRRLRHAGASHRQRGDDLLRIRRHRLGHGDVRRVEVHLGARGGLGRVAARGGRLLQARAAGVS